MSNTVKKVARTRRSVLGETAADATDPIGANQVEQEDKGIAAEQLEAAKQTAAAEALADAEAKRALTLIDPTAMPTEGDTNRARRRAAARNLARRGRASTILTSADDALGGEA